MWHDIEKEVPVMNSIVEIAWSDKRREINIWRGTQLTMKGITRVLYWRYMKKIGESYVPA